MEALQLNDYYYLFKDNEAQEKFADILKERMQQDWSPIMYNSEVLGVAISPETTKRILTSRLTERD